MLALNDDDDVTIKREAAGWEVVPKVEKPARVENQRSEMNNREGERKQTENNHQGQ